MLPFPFVAMVFIALYLRPWLLFMQTLGATPRLLADDMLLHVVGPHCLSIFVEAYHNSMVFVEAMGGKIAPLKCMLFATLATHREFLRRYMWQLNSNNMLLYRMVLIAG